MSLRKKAVKSDTCSGTINMRQDSKGNSMDGWDNERVTGGKNLGWEV